MKDFEYEEFMKLFLNEVEEVNVWERFWNGTKFKKLYVCTLECTYEHDE